MTAIFKNVNLSTVEFWLSILKNAESRGLNNKSGGSPPCFIKCGGSL